MNPDRSGTRIRTHDDGEGLWEWSLESDRILFSPRWLALIGCEDYEVGSTPENWFQRVHPDDRAQLLRDVEGARAGDSTTFTCRYRLRHKDDTYRWISCRGQVVQDSAGRAIRLTGSQSDITVQMVTDRLTGLPNRLLLADHLTQSIERARRYKAFHFAVLLVDLGRTAGLGQPSGATVSDPLLVAVARRLETCLRIPETTPGMRNNDLVARVDGDRFAILLDGLKEVSHAKVAAERILGQMMSPFVLGAREVRLSASIGIAVSETGYTTADEVLRDAGTALHRARMLGGSHCEFFDTAILQAEQAELQIEGDFDAALQRAEFELFYQPIVALASNELLGFEALVRWRHPVLGMIVPADFIPIAERTGFILPLGNWILREACFRLSEWQTRQPVSRDLWVSVNVSSVQWCDPALLDQIGEALRDSGLEPRRLMLELTEGIAMANPTAITTLLMRLRALGVRISIDDFGTGYSSLAYLRQFPIDMLKIDRSFVRGIATHKDTAEIVGSLLNMAHQLGLHVVAEGIENEDQCAQLHALKCAAGQGYLFAKPLDVNRAAAVSRTGLPPRLERPPQATIRHGYATRLRKLWVQGRLFAAGRPAALAATALALLLSAGLVAVVDRGRPTPSDSRESMQDMNMKQPAAMATPHSAVPVSTTERVVESRKDSSSAPLPAASLTPSTGISHSPLVAVPAVVTQTASLNVVHLHRLGSCRGRLDVTRNGVEFVSAEGDHDEAFALKYTEFVHALSDDTLTLKSATRTYRFRTGGAGPEGAVQLRDVADRIARSRR